jgi:HD-GYP domain-containing protein (c-di-GMP phosphodiesterase class II)
MVSSVISAAAFVDKELLSEFRDSLTDQAGVVEREVAILRRTPKDFEAVAKLFRALHSIKGDSTVCRFDLGVRITHPLETLLAQVRDGSLIFTPLLAEAMLLALDRLELAVEGLLDGRDLTPLKLDVLITGLDRLGRATQSMLDDFSFMLVESVTGFRPAGKSAGQVAEAPVAKPPSPGEEDLAFFKSLAQMLDDHAPQYKGRTERLCKLALATNARAGSPVSPDQLEAAIYMHDVGMMFLSEDIWLKGGALNDADRELLRSHPGFGAGLLSRMANWREAAMMVAQHHEMDNGKGYPKGLKGNEIAPGAKIIAIVDAFESVTLKHSSRGAGRSLLRAIAEVNASDTQFSPEWIAHFNVVVRGMMEG